jgi:2-polyprenyl-6-methoxyphenol hydroxylase-like FAD-dependent oxidoreductase
LTDVLNTTPAENVVIVGAGPVGLMLAIELRLAGVQPVVIERLPAISEIPKGNGLVGQIVQVLDYRGLLEPLRAESTYTGPVPSFSFGPLQLDFAGTAPSPLHVLAIPQRRLEHVLTARLADLGCTVRRGHEMTSFDQDNDAATITVTGPDGPYRLRAAYLVGCDGAHSPVRKLAGIEFPGYTSPEVSLIGRVTLPDAVTVARSGEIELPGLGRVPLMVQQRTPQGMFSLAPLTSLDATAADGAYIVYTREDAGSAVEVPDRTRMPDREPPVTLAELQASFRRVTGADVRMTDPTSLSRTASNTRQADRYQAGRVLLAGDAAHVFGLALNAGLLDSINLGWKLAAQVQGRAPAGLLASYHTERHAAGHRALLHTRAQRALTGNGETADAIRELFGELLTLPGVARHVGELIAGTDVRYDMPGSKGPQTAGPQTAGPGRTWRHPFGRRDRPSVRHPLTGRLAPDLRVTTQDGTSTRVAELMRTARPLLLDFTADGRVAAVAAGDDEPVSILVAKPHGQPTAADALLIRPDGIVAWASGPGAADPAAGLADALAAWFSG